MNKVEELTEKYENTKKLYLEIKPNEETKDVPDESEQEERAENEAVEEIKEQEAIVQDTGGKNKILANITNLAKNAKTTGLQMLKGGQDKGEVSKLDTVVGTKKILSSITKIAKTATGIQGLQDRKSAKNIKSISEAVYKAASELTEAKRVELNDRIVSFGKFRLESLHETIGRFLSYLKDMDQKNKVKEYEILDGIGLTTKTIEEMTSIDMNVSKALASTAITGALGAAAAMGTPTLVTGAVTALASASTGTAISSLSGAAASNAVLAWLGGGSLSTIGGGGMAAGAAVLSGITVGATAGVAILAAGMMASTHYARKLTEAKEYQKNVEIAVAEMEKGWTLMDGISKRTDEMCSITKELDIRIKEQLDYLEPLAINFDTSNEYYNRTFQKSGLLIKSMGELSQTPLLNEEGNVSDESMQIISKTHSILNKELTYNE